MNIFQCSSRHLVAFRIAALCVVNVATREVNGMPLFFIPIKIEVA